MDLGPEFRLFCLALRRPQSADDIRQMRSLAGEVKDWKTIVLGAQRHRVASLVQAGLRTCDCPQLPSYVSDELHRLSRANARRSLARIAEVGRLGRLFADAGIRVLVLKGEVLSVQLYGEAGWRTARDIDLLVDPDQFLQARAVLAEAGYRQHSNFRSPRQDAAYLRSIKELEFFHAVTGGLVELHHRLTANPHLYPAEFASLWDEREEVHLGDWPVATLSRHRLPLYLCVHGADHGWARLQWLMDFAGAIRQSQSVDTLVEAADKAGLRCVFLHALALSHQWLGLPIENRLLVDHGNSAQGKRLDWLLGRLCTATDWYDAAPKRALRYALWERLYRLSLKSDWRYRASQVKQDWFCPADWDAVPLPQALSWLYPFVRPWGWLIRRRSLS
jgi:hypothetical protein